LEREGVPPPYWAFAWAGGQALARHILDHPNLVGGRTILDVGAGSGLIAIAAMLAGAARATANEVDPFSAAAISLNAEANGVTVDHVSRDILDEHAGADVVLIGDLFYEPPLGRRALAFAERAAGDGAEVLIGDPGRPYLPKEALQALALYAVPTPRALEDTDLKRTTVWQLKRRPTG
ncbi:MAG: 50S ribosomal protein L11 methyltransferase, partial [Pseudomonadota bacterium]